MTLAAFAALCSGVFGKSVQQQIVVLGRMSLGGNIVPVENLAESLQVAFYAGAKRILLPMARVKDIPTIPGELFAKFQTRFYALLRCIRPFEMAFGPRPPTLACPTTVAVHDHRNMLQSTGGYSRNHESCQENYTRIV